MPGILAVPNILPREFIFRARPRRVHVAHSATRSTDAASRNRPVVMAVRDSVRDLHRASRALCASDARLHPTTGDR
jgi:hypothetical protein